MARAISNEFLNQKLDYAIEKIAGVDGKVDTVNNRLDENYVTKDYFELRMQPLEQSKKIVFGFIGLLLTAFATTIIGFFLTQR